MVHNVAWLIASFKAYTNGDLFLAHHCLPHSLFIALVASAVADDTHFIQIDTYIINVEISKTARPTAASILPQLGSLAYNAVFTSGECAMV